MIEQPPRFAICPPLKKGAQGGFFHRRKGQFPLSSFFKGDDSTRSTIQLRVNSCYRKESASAQSDFYRGKTITLIVNMAAGDANDLGARLGAIW
jgi:hypothetical protein